MARFLVQSGCIALLLAIVHAQVTPSPERFCTDDGPRYIAHHIYPELFFQCGAQGTRFLQRCAPGTLFDEGQSVCVAPAAAVNPSLPCPQTISGIGYAALCPTGYFVCAGGAGAGYVERNCTPGTYFDMNSRQCINTVIADHPLCSRAGPSQVYACTLREGIGGNNCKFRYVGSRFEDVETSCPEGLMFNITSCGCHITTPVGTCSKSGPDMLANKVLDYNCPESFNTELGSLPIKTTSPKLNNAELNVIYFTVGHSVSNGKGYLRTDPSSGKPAELFTHYFANNELSPNTAFTYIMRMENGANNQVQNTPVILMTNAYKSECARTIEATITRNGNGFTMTIFVAGSTRTGNMESRSNATISGTLNNVGANNFIQASIFFAGGAVSGQLVDRGNGNTPNTGISSNVVNIGPSAVVGDTIARNRCGMTFYSNMNGEVNKLAIREGCGDTSKVRV